MAGPYRTAVPRPPEFRQKRIKVCKTNIVMTTLWYLGYLAAILPTMATVLDGIIVTIAILFVMGFVNLMYIHHE